MKIDTMKAQSEAKWTPAEPLPLEHCGEYDAAAEWCAIRGIKGLAGDPLPANMATDGALKYINADPEAFQERVRQCAYAIAAQCHSVLDDAEAQAPALVQALELALCYMEADGDDEQEREDYDRIKSIIARAKGEETT